MTLGPRCGGCALKSAGGKGWVIEDGRGELGVALVAEAPGEEEAQQSLPMVGSTGKLLNRIIERTPYAGRKLKRDDFWITNIIRCRPPDNELTGAPYEEASIAQCAPYLMEWLEKRKPRAIVTLGNQPLRWFTSQWGIDQLRGYIWETKWGPVVGTYHPAYLLRGKMPLARVIQLDITRAIEVAQKGIPKVAKHYLCDPDIHTALRFAEEYERHGGPPLSVDIETPHSSLDKDEEADPEAEEINVEDNRSYTILRISFSFEPGRALSMQWVPPFTTIARRLLMRAKVVIGWNFLSFDLPRLEANDAPVPGIIWDGMDMFHFLEPALPAGLKKVGPIYRPDMPPWKLMSRDNPAWYNAADADVALSCVLKIKQRLEERGQWTTFERHFIELSNVLRAMSRRGILVDKEQRARDLARFAEERERVTDALQKVIPTEVKPQHKYKLTKAQLEKRGLWVEGKMREWSE